MSAPYCQNCIHWQGELWNDLGECRRYPPVIVDVPHAPKWPETRQEDSCGEHKPMPQDDRW